MATYARFASSNSFDIQLSGNYDRHSSVYYDGNVLSSRMDEIRKSIVYIRQKWPNMEEREKLIEALKKFLHKLIMEEREVDFLVLDRFDEICRMNLDWGKVPSAVTKEDCKNIFATVNCYTSPKGYDNVFRKVNNHIFRQDEAIDKVDEIRCAVLLIELINIELFNIVLSFPEKDNFIGTVYRGIGLKEKEFDWISSRTQQPISERYIAIPLFLTSSSMSRTQAEEFMCNSSGDRKLLMKIHVIEMQPKLLAEYRKRFPTSIVSTICAVHINDISELASEDEVLLRGAFFQVLRFTKDKDHNNKEIDVLEVVMLNTNRDHISTAFLGDKDTPARNLFGAMVSVTRYTFAIKFCQDNDLLDDAVEYETLLSKASEKLKELLQEVP